jgi:hypothetical protein
MLKKYLKFKKLNLNNEQIEQLLRWKKIHDFLVPYPQFVKEKILSEYNLPNSTWIETGTLVGTTAKYLSTIGKQVITLEPSLKFFNISKENLKQYSNIKIINDSSENCLEEVLKNLKAVNNICFWLDGHFSGGDTFQGEDDTPILKELKVIERYLESFEKISILVDDFRLFNTKNLTNKEVYPDKSELVNWSEKNKLFWTVKSDIFIITNHKYL